ncbi:MAG: hypothetical protein IKP47_02300 [Ruminococcus sp.]|nr:hypothetical protein [Ruminococcus sp.]
MKKTAAAFLSALLLFFAVFACLPGSLIRADAESLYIRKIVSVVYDDSGSMMDAGSANWAYASYAMQAFCGLLNGDDQLYITYMSPAGSYPNSYQPEQIDLSSSGIQASVDGIREHIEGGGTPYWALDIAYDKLRSVSDSNPNTQYWLVVITDGDFFDTEGVKTKEELDSKLSSFSGSTMPNGSSPNITYLSIGEGIVKPDSDPQNDLYVYSSSGAEDIVKVMSEIADKVSGRSRLSASDIVLKDSRTVEITSGIPLLNIAVLSQKTGAAVKEVRQQDGQKLSVMRHASLRYPEYPGWTTDKSLFGGTFLIGGSSDIIGAGTYTIEFSEDISLDNIVIMFEPAIDIRMKYTKDGQEITDLSKLCEGDRIDISCKLYEMGSDNEISPSLLPADTAYSIEVSENGSSSSKSDSLELKNVVLKNTATEVTATVKISGFMPITVTSGEFTPRKGVSYTVEVEPKAQLRFTVQELKGNTEKLTFRIYADGAAVTKEEAEALPFEIATELAGETRYENDGTVTFTPAYRDPITANPTGDVSVTGSINGGGSAAATVYVKPLEYTIKVKEPDDKELIRTELHDNTKGVSFEFFAENEKLSKEAVEKLAPEFAMSSPYDEKLILDISYADDGTVTAVPKNDGSDYFAGYGFVMPAGKLDITVSASSGSASGTLYIENDFVHELIFNYLIPFGTLLVILGEIFKKRFVYSAKLYYNRASCHGSYITGPITGWEGNSMLNLRMFIPFLCDKKKIGGITFCAGGRLGGREMITVKRKKCPEFTYTVSSSLSCSKSIGLTRGSLSIVDKEDKEAVLVFDEGLVTSETAGLNSCSVYYYSEE